MWSIARQAALATALSICGVAGANVIYVPAMQPTIQAAIDVAASGDTVAIDGSAGPFTEALAIPSETLDAITIMGEVGKPRPLLLSVTENQIQIKVVNTVNLPCDVTLIGMDLDGANTGKYGVRSKSWDYEGEDPLVTLRLRDLLIMRYEYGIAIGSRTGTWGCSGRWGSIDYDTLGQSVSRFFMDRCTVMDCLDDGINLWRVRGEVTNSLIGYNLDEGIHTTDAGDMLFEHNVIVANHGIAMHFQITANTIFRNNAVIRTLKGVIPGVEDLDGFGVVVGGSYDERLQILNNQFVANDCSGVKVNPAEIVLSPDHCVYVATQVDVLNNVFTRNGLTDNPDMPKEDLVYSDRGLPGMEMIAQYNFFPETGRVSNITLDETNIIGVDPLFVDPPSGADLPDTVRTPETFHDRAVDRLEGYALTPGSPAVDAGHPDAQYEDAGGLAQGGPRNDVGMFGGTGSDWGP